MANLLKQSRADRLALSKFSEGDIVAVRAFADSVKASGEALSKGRVIRVTADTVKQMMNAGGNGSAFSFDRATLRFVTRRGLVADNVVKAAAEALVSDARFKISDAALRLQQGTLSAADWIEEHNRLVKLLNGAESALGRGGIDQMTPRDWEKAGDKVFDQYGYSRAFAEDVAGGRYGVVGQELKQGVLQRAESYANAGRATYENTRVDNAKDKLNHTKARRILGDADSCPDCIAAAADGWVDIEDVVEIGDSVCNVNCHCIIVTGEEGNLIA